MDSPIAEEQLSWIQAARTICYRVLAQVFAAESDEELVSLAQQPEVHDAFDVLGGSGAQEMLSRLADLESSDYAALFVGPGPEDAPPWESAYRASDGLVMGKVTLEVRESFAKAGYSAPQHSHVPDDHLATELSFLGSLSEKQGTTVLQKNFIDQHLGLWVDRFADRVLEARPQSPYAQAASVLSEFVHADRELLDEISAMDNA